MTRYEYTVVAAPLRAEKLKGARTPADRFAGTLTQVLNEMAQQGWEYVRAETLPSEERSGLTSRNTVWNNVLIFRRALGATAEATAMQPAPVAAAHGAQTPRPAAQPDHGVPGQPQPGPSQPGPAQPAAAQPTAANPFSEPMRALTPDAPAR